jgi:hypothetical protein
MRPGRGECKGFRSGALRSARVGLVMRPALVPLKPRSLTHEIG